MSRLDTAEERISECKHVNRTFPNWNAEEENRMKKQKEKQKTDQNIQELWDNFKRCIIGIPEGGKRESRGNFWSNDNWKLSKIKIDTK